MNLSKCLKVAKRLNLAMTVPCTILAGFFLVSAAPLQSKEPAPSNAAGQVANDPSRPAPECSPAELGSPYIPVDSWVYPAMLRLYSLGYTDSMYIGLRPWTRASVEHMLEEASVQIQDAQDDGDKAADEADDIYEAVDHFINPDTVGPCLTHQGHSRIESVYTKARGISGPSLRDSYHVGSTIVNDYGRPYQNGFNEYSGASAFATAGRFALYVRGEFQGAPSATGYSASVAQTLSTVDQVLYINPANGLPYNQATIPAGAIPTATDFRFLEAYVSGQVFNHVISFGKVDQWIGPAQGASMAYSNNAQNIYGFEVNRIEPLRVPLLSRVTGPFRYEFLLGALRGHNYMPNPAYEAKPGPNIANVTNPGDPWVHVEKLSFRPTQNLELGFERTVLFGGEGHSPVTLDTFLKSFFSTVAGGCPNYASPPKGTLNNKCGRNDPGARFGAFDFSYRLPYVRKWLTLYSDSHVHDDISPIDAPRRAAIRPGIYLSHFPGVPKLDLRVEAASTDPVSQTVGTREYGRVMYWGFIERQGYTNQGQLFGDWIGREDKGGQAWLTYHLSGNEWIQVNARNQKATKDFIPGSGALSNTSYPCSVTSPCLENGTTLNDFGFQVVKRLGKDIEVNGNFTVEHWTVPLLATGQQTVTTTDIQVTWFPNRKVSF
jgi:hypothetical protein